MIRFEVDPTLVADALSQGCKLVIEVSPDGRTKRASLGQPSPYRKVGEAFGVTQHREKRGF